MIKYIFLILTKLYPVLDPQNRLDCRNIQNKVCLDIDIQKEIQS